MRAVTRESRQQVEETFAMSDCEQKVSIFSKSSSGRFCNGEGRGGPRLFRERPRMSIGMDGWLYTRKLLRNLLIINEFEGMKLLA